MKEIKFTKQSGEIQYRDYLYSRLDSALKTLSNGEYTLSIKKNVKRRSLDQNALSWMWYTCIERETGSDRNDVHAYYCEKFLKRPITINGIERIVTGGTSKLNSAEMADFLNKVQADAAQEFGIVLPSPEDLYFNEFRNEYENR